MNRPTPETDARTYVPSIGASTVPADFSRKLEQERDEAREALLAMRDHYRQWSIPGTLYNQVERVLEKLKEETK